jgi:predicted HicB family RNase H-like nuclease
MEASYISVSMTTNTSKKKFYCEPVILPQIEEDINDENIFPPPPPIKMEDPQWETMEEKQESKILREFKLERDIKEFVGTIISLDSLRTSENKSLEDLEKKLHLKINMFFSSEKEMATIFQKIKGNEDASLLFLKIDFTKKRVRSFFGECFNGRQEKIDYQYSLLKPLNKVTELACYSYMNDEVEKLCSKEYI